MSPKEKLERLLNPKSPADYGLSVSLSELQSFPEGSEYFKDFQEKYIPADKSIVS